MSEVPCGPVMIRRNELRNVGDECPPHTHNFDHATRGCDGLMLLRLTFPDGRVVEQQLRPGTWANVPAEALHQVVALAPNSAFECIFPHRTPDGGVVDRYVDWSPAYH